MQTRIALIAKPGPELHELRAQLKNPLRFALREFLSLGSVARELGDYEFDLLLMRVGHFTERHVQMLEKVRRRFPKAPLITAAPRVDPSARYQARKLSNHKLILEPGETQDLARIIEKMRKGDPGALRLHARTRREGMAEIVDHAGQRIQAKFLDIAQMGARLIIRPREPIARATHLELHYPSQSEPGRVHRIQSVVVWEGGVGGMVDSIVNGPYQVLGLRFIAAL